MAHLCMVMVAMALVGLCAVARALVRKMQCAMGRHHGCPRVMYDHCGAAPLWRVVRDTNIPIKAGSAEWNVVETWFGLMWARDPTTLSITCKAGRTAAYAHAVEEWTSLPPPSHWAQVLH